MTSEVAATLTKHCFVRETGIIPEAATSEVLAGAVGIMASPHIVVIAQTGLNIGCIGKPAGRSSSNVVSVVPDWSWQWRHAQITTIGASDTKIGRVRLGDNSSSKKSGHWDIRRTKQDHKEQPIRVWVWEHPRHNTRNSHNMWMRWRQWRWRRDWRWHSRSACRRSAGLHSRPCSFCTRRRPSLNSPSPGGRSSHNTQRRDWCRAGICHCWCYRCRATHNRRWSYSLRPCRHRPVGCS
jgi:hypothetical protein